LNISVIISRQEIKNNINRNNKTQESTYKFKYKNKSKEKDDNLKKIKLINNNNYKSEKYIGNQNLKIERCNKNINTLNNISKKINIFINNNKSLILNYQNLLKNKSFQNKKNRITMNMNIHKNIKKELLTKSLIKKNEKSYYDSNYKNNSYKSYKEKYILNMVKSYKNFSYRSQEKSEEKNNNREKKNKYYNNQKKIHENKISKVKKNNRCKKDNVELSAINIYHNDLVNLSSIKYNKKSHIIKDKLLNKEVLKPIFNNKKRFHNYIITNKKGINKEDLNVIEDNRKVHEIKNSKKKLILYLYI